GSLAKSFNTMAISLREKMNRVEEQRWHLVRSEKMASVGRLATGVAHEVGNPLQSIMGFADLLLSEKGIDNKTSRDFIGRIQSEANRIHRIIRELLDYSRPVTDVVEAIHLKGVVEQSVQLMRPQQRFREVVLDCEGLTELPAVYSNSQRLVQVIVNLLLNAADAMNGKGRVELKGYYSDANPNQVELHVSNDGPPIPPEDRERIFDPFFTTKNPGQGTGLGLAICQSIMESINGSLFLADVPQTCFVVRIPKAKV
ncbi:MAG: ATP-binding protein, partial [Pseudomonadota bacterium]